MTAATITSVPGARPVVEIGVGDSRTDGGAARWDVNEWDDPAAVWSGGEPSWFDVSCDVHDIEANVGSSSSVERWEVGNATVTLNNDTGWADFGAAPADPAVLSLRPGRAIRIGVALDGGDPRWLFRGFIDAMRPSYDPVEADTVTLDCIDAKGAAGKVELVEVELAVGAGETATTRIHRLLNEAGWRWDARAVDETSTTMIPTVYGKRCVDLLDVTADSAGGAVFADTAGRVVFRAADWRVSLPGIPPDATIGNAPADVVFGASDVVFGASDVVWGFGHPDDVCPVAWDLSSDLADFATQVMMSRADETGGAMITDYAAAAIYGFETFARTDLICESADMLETLARRAITALNVDNMPDVEAVTLDASTSVTARDVCASVDPTLPSRYRCCLIQSGRSVFDREFVAVGVEHRIDADTWTCRIALDNAAPFAIAGGRWGSARWDEDEWAADFAALAAEAAELIGTMA